MRWDIAGERGIRITVAETPSPSTTQNILRLCHRLQDTLGDALTDTAPGYTTLTVFWHPERLDRAGLIRVLETLIDANPDPVLTEHSQPDTVISLPVFYDPECGADLTTLAETKGLSVEEVIDIHSGQEYFAFANGFAPGFCYLGELPEILATPRRATPRRTVPAGSVAIADRQTAIYPSESPGGWHLLGRCPVSLFDLGDSPPTHINIGDRVRFQPIDRATFLDLGGVL